MKKYTPHINTHVGETIKDEIRERHITQKELSEASGIPKTILNEIIKGKRSVNAEYAVRLEVSLGIDAEYWMAAQSNYDIWEQRRMFKLL